MATNRRISIKSVPDCDESEYKEGNIRLLALPDEILENVLSFLNFDEASEARLVSILRIFSCICPETGVQEETQSATQEREQIKLDLVACFTHCFLKKISRTKY